MYLHSEMFTIYKLINISIPSHSYLFLVMRAPEIYLSKFQAYAIILLTTVSMFHFKSLGLILHNHSFANFDQHFSIYPTFLAFKPPFYSLHL